MDNLSCALGAEVVEASPPVALLRIAGAVLASLCVVTGSKWMRESGKQRASSSSSSATTNTSTSSSGTDAPPAQATAKAKKAKTYPEYDIDAIKLHSSAKDAWVVIGDGVYDVTKWAPHHPGGERNIVDISGRSDWV